MAEPQTQDSKIEFDPKAPDRDTYIKIKEMDLESGWLGRLFGSPKNAAVNIGGLALCVALIAGMIITINPGGSIAVEAWKIISPIMTMILGFLFGRKS